jgi:hypothetical protein
MGSFRGDREQARPDASSVPRTMATAHLEFDGLFARAVERRRRINIEALCIVRLTLSPGSRRDNFD